MSDDVNNLNGRPVNSLDDFSEIDKIGRRARKSTTEDIMERSRLRQAEEGVAQAERAMAVSPRNSEFYAYAERMARTDRRVINRLSSRIGLREQVQLERHTALTQSAIERHFSRSTVNGMASEFASSEAAQNMSMRMMNVPFSDLQERKSAIMNQIGQLEQQSVNMSENLYDTRGRFNPDTYSQLQANYNQKNRLARLLGVNLAAQRRQKAAGLDPESQLDSLYSAGTNAERILGKNDISEQMRSGTGLGALSISQLKQKEINEATELVEALNKLKNAATMSAEEVDKLKEQAKSAAENLEKTQEAVRQYGSGGGGSGLRSYGAALSGAGAIGGAAFSLFRDIALGQTNQITMNRITAAQQSNDLYARRNAAIGGDMTQLSLMSSDAFLRAENEGKTNRKISTASTAGLGISGLLTAGGAFATTLGLGMSATGVGAVAGLPLAALGATAAGIGAATGGISNVSDAIRGGSATQEELAERQRQITLQEEMARVTGNQRQQLYNYSMGSRNAMLNIGGSRGAAFMEQFAGKGGDAMLNQMEQARIGTEQFAQLAAQAGLAQGSVFNANQIFGARDLESRGLGDMSMNMGRMSTLAGAGANNPQASLASVMEAAMTKSLDSSKSLNLMVEHTAQMAQTSAAVGRGGQDATAAASSLLANLVNPNAENKESAIQRAASAAERINNINSGIGVNFADMSGVAAISRASGVGHIAALNLKSLDDPTVQTLRANMRRIQGADPKERQNLEKAFAAQLTDQYGLGQFANTVNGTVNMRALEAGIEERGKSLIRSGSTIGGVNQNTFGYKEFINTKMDDRAEFLKKIQNDPRYAKLREELGGVASREGLSLSEFMLGGTSADTTAGKNKLAGTGLSGAGKTADELATSAMKNMTAEARTAAKELGGVAEALSKINQATQGLVSKMEGDGGGDMRGAAAQAAKDFNMSAKTFQDGVKDFGLILRDFARGANIKLPSVDSKTDKR